MARLASRLIVTVLTLEWTVADAARILGVFPYPSYSHQVVFQSLTMELARRGHELTVFTTDPASNLTLDNYTQVDLHFLYDLTTRNIDFYSKSSLGLWSFLHDIDLFNEQLADRTLSHPAMRRLLSPSSVERFDLVIVQCIYYDALYALAARFDAPLIGIVSTPLLSIHHYILGSPLQSAYSPDLWTGFDENMSTWQRFVNLYYQLRQIYRYRFKNVPVQERVVRKHFGDGMPPAHQLVSRISLLMVYAHPFYASSRPNVPEVVYIGGCRQIRQEKSMPQELEDLLNDSKEGYVYFSLGSNIKSNLLPADRRDMLLRTFAKLPYDVLWKFESDYLPHKPANVVIRKWLPQQQILAHPNVRLFIYQGGLQSTEEAIQNGVPVLGFPIILDQTFNAMRLQSHGAGKMLRLADTDEDELREAIIEIASNYSYKENMLKLRDLLQDLPYDPLDNAVWWAEHVIRHRGAAHLRTRSRDMPWYQVQMLDVTAIALAAAVLAVRVAVVARRLTFELGGRLAARARATLTRDDSKKRQ